MTGAKSATGISLKCSAWLSVLTGSSAIRSVLNRSFLKVMGIGELCIDATFGDIGAWLSYGALRRGLSVLHPACGGAC